MTTWTRSLLYNERECRPKSAYNKRSRRCLMRIFLSNAKILTASLFILRVRNLHLQGEVLLGINVATHKSFYLSRPVRQSWEGALSVFFVLCKQSAQYNINLYQLASIDTFLVRPAGK